MNPEEMAELRKLARKAPPGPYTCEGIRDARFIRTGAYTPSVAQVSQGGELVLNTTSWSYGREAAEALEGLICALYPQAVLSLLDELERKDEEIGRLEKEVGEMGWRIVNLLAPNERA